MGGGAGPEHGAGEVAGPGAAVPGRLGSLFVPIASYRTMGWLRAAVGVALMAAPAVPMRLAGRDPSSAEELLMRTIGIRDLVLGLGTLVATHADGSAAARRWVLAGLASDSLDTVASLVSLPAIGARDASAAAALALAFVGADIQVLVREAADRTEG
jgi:hypothetical protein